MTSVLIIDNYDSFSYNLLHLFRETRADVEVVHNDKISVKEVREKSPRAIVFSPGPGTIETPEDIGESRAIFDALKGTIPMLGVCLGHQLFGGKVKTCEPAHGEKETIHILDHQGLFRDIKKDIEGMRYHSLCVDPNHIPEGFEVTAKTNDGVVMAMEDRKRHIYGVQFHPESIGTPEGATIIKNFLNVSF